MRSIDYLIVGAGIVGLSIAKELRVRNPQSKILVLEKELRTRIHLSGGNIAVLHSGILLPRFAQG